MLFYSSLCQLLHFLRSYILARFRRTSLKRGDFTNFTTPLARENIRFSSLFAAGDVSRGTSYDTLSSTIIVRSRSSSFTGFYNF